MTLVEGSEPYPWPYDGRFSPLEAAVVLAGWDRHWGAAVAPHEAQAATERCTALASGLGSAGALLVTIAHREAEPLPFPADPARGPRPLAVAAEGLDGFWGGPLEAVLRAHRRRYLLVAGLGLEAPVHSVLRAANDRGFECLLVLDACAALDADLRDASASMVCMSGGIFGAVGTTSAVLAGTTEPSIPSPTGAPA